MKRNVVFFAALALAGCVFVPGALHLARAQAQAGEPAAAAEQKLQQVSQVLNLSPTQKSQLEPILQAELPKLEAVKNNPSLSGREKKKQMKAIHNQTDPQVKAILNPTQYKQWESMRQNEINEIKEEKK
jgi:periplasmic protein CpxP/Spy